MEKPKPEQFSDYDTYKDALSEWRVEGDEEEEHPWRFAEERDEPSSVT